MTNAIVETDLPHLNLLHKGKVRDIYAVDDEHLLIVATDRLSAFDVILPTPLPGKGAILANISDFWFKRTSSIIQNHCSSIDLREVICDDQKYQQLKCHAVVVRKMQNLPVEAIVRGYIIGSGWKDYLSSGQVCGITLPLGLQQAEQLPNPIFTPSTKASVGDHDENVAFDRVVAAVGWDMAEEIRKVSLAIYHEAFGYAKRKGILIADTKFEFGINKTGDLVLIDEVLTPDSSRFWDMRAYQVGISPPSYDKQIVRDYLEQLDWDKKSPGPILPPEIAAKALGKYKEVESKLLGA